MIKILVEVDGGVVINVKANQDSEVLIVDWDDNAMEPLRSDMSDKEFSKVIDSVSSKLKQAKYTNINKAEDFI